MDGRSLLSSLSSSLLPCRKVYRLHPSAQIESALPQRFKQLYMSCMSFICPCRTWWLQCFTVSAGGVSTAGGIVDGSRSICRLSQSCTLPPLTPTAPPNATLSFSSAMHFVFLHAQRHTSQIPGFSQVNSVIVPFGNVIPASSAALSTSREGR